MAKVIDATGLILGRLATRVAKLALAGENIEIVNCEKAVFTGEKSKVCHKYLDLKRKRNPFHGPFTTRMPDRFVKRVIRPMLPFKKQRGQEAYKRIKCHIGVPENLKNSEMVSFPEISKEKITRSKIVTVEDISKRLGAKYNE